MVRKIWIKGKPKQDKVAGIWTVCSQKQKGSKGNLKPSTFWALRIYAQPAGPMDRLGLSDSLLRKRWQQKLTEVRQRLLKIRGMDIYLQGKWLKSVVQGHNNYYAVPGNRKALEAFRSEICRSWLRALRR